MKTLVSVLIAGALSTSGAFAGAAGTASPQVPFRLFDKRPAGARQAAVAAPKVDVAAPQLPFRPYQKRPTVAPSKPSGIEAKRQ
jgi:hypothetical protein